MARPPKPVEEQTVHKSIRLKPVQWDLIAEIGKVEGLRELLDVIREHWPYIQSQGGLDWLRELLGELRRSDAEDAQRRAATHE